MSAEWVLILLTLKVHFAKNVAALLLIYFALQSNIRWTVIVNKTFLYFFKIKKKEKHPTLSHLIEN